VEGAGLLDCHLYRQPRRMILHIVNLSNPGAWRQPIDELIPIGPLRIKVRMQKDMPRGDLHLLTAGKNILSKMDKGWLHFELSKITDHEVIVIPLQVSG
jgi:hypothetical protein